MLRSKYRPLRGNTTSSYHTEPFHGLEEELEELDLTAAMALDEGLAPAIAKVTGLSVTIVKRRLEDVPKRGRGLHGRGPRVSKVFADVWPTSSRADIDLTRAPAARGDDNSSRGQGRDEHRRLQRAIAELGRLKDYHVETDRQLETGFKPDVAWRRHSEGQPHYLFEIEFGPHGARAKSIQCLGVARELWRSEIFLIVPTANQEAVRRMLSPSLALELKLCSVERCVNCIDDMTKLAEELGVPLGSWR